MAPSFLDQCSTFLDFRRSVNLRVAGFSFCTWLTDALLQPVINRAFFNDSMFISFLLCQTCFADQVVEQNLLLERLDISGCTSLTDTLLLRVTKRLYYIWQRTRSQTQHLIKRPDHCPGVSLPHSPHAPHLVPLPLGVWSLHWVPCFPSQVALEITFSNSYMN